MNIKKFCAVFCPLMIVVLLVITVSAVNYPKLYSADSKAEASDMSSKKAATGVQNILLIGRDRGGKLTDTIMFVHVDNDKKSVNILSIPRDTYVDGWKINAMNSIGGIKETVDCVEDIVGLKVDYYVSITTDVFKEIVDQLDGVFFDVPQDMDYEDPVQGLYIHLRQGAQLLNGDKAEQLVRFRHYVMGDLQRTQVQRDFMTAVVSQKKSLKYLNKAGDIYRSISDKVETNLTINDILANIITFKNLDVEKNLNAYILPNDPQNVGGISYVFIRDDDIRKLLVEKFGVKPSDIKGHSGKHVFQAGGVSNDNDVSYDSSYDDNTAWYEPQDSEPVSTDNSTGDEATDDSQKPAVDNSQTNDSQTDNSQIGSSQSDSSTDSNNTSDTESGDSSEESADTGTSDSE